MNGQQASRGFLLKDFGSLDILPVWTQTKQGGKRTNTSTDSHQSKLTTDVKMP